MADQAVTDTGHDFYVYVIFRVDGTPCYVGKGRKKRIDDHRRKSHNPWLRRIFKKANGELPIVKVRESLSNAEAIETEIALIKAIGRFDCGMGPLVNFTDGGEGFSGYKISKERSEKIAAQLRGRPAPWVAESNKRRKGVPKSPEHAEKLRRHLLLTKKTRTEKIAKVLAGRPKTPHEIAANPALQKGVPKTEAHKAALSAAHKGVALTPEHRAAIGAAHRGKRRSPEARAAMSAAQRKRRKIQPSTQLALGI